MAAEVWDIDDAAFLEIDIDAAVAAATTTSDHSEACDAETPEPEPEPESEQQDSLRRTMTRSGARCQARQAWLPPRRKSHPKATMRFY